MNSAETRELLGSALLLEEGKAEVPYHVAIIMDGNRRWAARRGLPAAVGHWRGAENLSGVVRSAAGLGIQVLTVYAFSTENWARPREEVSALLYLFKSYLNKQCAAMIADGVRLETIGDLSKLPRDVQTVLQETKEATAGGTRIELVLALNYGGRDDIRRAIGKIVQDCGAGRLNLEQLSEQRISQYLDTAKWPDPALLIRTSGELRQSNFLLWQSSYTELVYTETLWPDFGEQELAAAIREYQNRRKRFGKS